MNVPLDTRKYYQQLELIIIEGEGADLTCPIDTTDFGYSIVDISVSYHSSDTQDNRICTLNYLGEMKCIGYDSVNLVGLKAPLVSNNTADSFDTNFASNSIPVSGAQQVKQTSSRLMVRYALLQAKRMKVENQLICI